LVLTGLFAGRTSAEIALPEAFAPSAARVAFPVGAGVIDVKAQFGTKGDGVSDDTAAIQAAINFARHRMFVLYFPHGTYLVRDKLTFGSDEQNTKAIPLQGESRDRSSAWRTDRPVTASVARESLC
jgi:hypothetical protein